MKPDQRPHENPLGIALGDTPMAQAVFQHDWAFTPLGPMEQWPVSLRTAAALVLHSPVAMTLLWGPDGVMLFNDAYADIAGSKRFTALGQTVFAVWPEVSDFLREVLSTVLGGKSISYRDQELTLFRDDRPGKAYFDLDFSAVFDERARPAGVLATVFETTERRRLAEQVQAEHERFLELFEQSPTFMTVLRGPEHRVEMANPGYLQLVGHREVLGKTIVEALPEAAAQGYIDLLDQVFRSGEAFKGIGAKYAVQPVPDGPSTERYLDFVYQPIRDSGGEVTGIFVEGVDVTDRVQADAAMREVEENNRQSAEQFRALAEAAPNHVWTSRTDGHLDWFNQRVYEYSGVAEAELAGTGWTQIVHPDDLPAAAAQWAASLQSGEPYETEFRIRRADGEFRWHLVRALPLRNAQSMVVRWVGTNTDNHAGKLALDESARDRNRIWSLSQELMLVCDFAGTITDINPSATLMLGWLPEEMIGQLISDFIHPDDLHKTAAELGSLSARQTAQAFENRYRHKDGSYRLLAWNAVPDSGFIHAVARDITRERLAEEALRQSQKLDAIGQLTGGVAHDFNNVLAVISNSVDVLKRLPAVDARRERFMNAISNSVTRASKLTGQLLAFARRQTLQPMVFNAGENTRAVGEMIQTLAGAGIELDLKLPEHPCFINADPSQFDTALINLAVNARDAMAEKGKLTIEVFATEGIPAMPSHNAVAGDFVAIAIGDTGTGIAPGHLSQIFEPFFTTKPMGVGTGLGLSQVFGFAKQSGGDIRVESTVGRGSRFTLYLPRAPRPGDEALQKSADKSASLEGSGCILVVEDNPELAASVRETLHVIGYSTVVVPSAEEALGRLHENASRFAAVFSDVVMAGMSGIELAWEVNRIYGTLPVVLTSGYSYVLAQEADHDFNLLPKPYSVDELAHALDQVIHRSRTGYRPRRAALPPLV